MNISKYKNQMLIIDLYFICGTLKDRISDEERKDVKEKLQDIHANIAGLLGELERQDGKLTFTIPNLGI